jgi:hypothetical protein
MKKLLFAAVLLAAPLRALAWGAEGHQVVALIAESELTPAAKARVNALLALEPGATLESISTWPDEHRSPETSAWHYVNFPRGDCHYVPDRDCPDGQCVVAALDRERAKLSQGSPEDRLKALKYVVHLVGDSHQPLHAGYADDRGGNQYQIQGFGRGTNLHALWDSGLPKQIDPDPESLARSLESVPVTASTDFDPARWAEESCRIVGEDGFYPPHRLPYRYADQWTPVLEERLEVAAKRLAALLNGL